jgi:hypothetical protein
MYENLIPPLIILSFIIFLIVIPALLYTGLKKIADPVPLRYPLLLAVAVVLVMAVFLQLTMNNKDNPIAGAMGYYLLLFTLISLAVITPYFLLGKKIRIDRPLLMFSLLSFMGVALLLFNSMGETTVEGPRSPFFPGLPLTGWLLDGAASMLNIQGIVYSATLPLYSVLFAVGLSLEVFIIAALFYALLGVVSPVKIE